MSTVTFIEELRRRVPEVEPLYREHLRDNDELLPHVMMGDIARFAEELHGRSTSGSARASEILSRVLEVLENGMSQDEAATRELIVASFLENLDRSSPSFAQLKNRLGEALSRALENQGTTYGEI